MIFRCIILTLALSGCQSSATPTEATSESATESKLITVDLGGQDHYIIDPIAEACFLVIGNSPPMVVSCRKLHKNLPEAAEQITWVKPPRVVDSAPREYRRRDEVPSQQIQEGIVGVDEITYEIKQSLVDDILNNPTSVARGARIVPSIKNGKANGFKIYAVRPSSFYSQIGLRNGDTIHAVNGFDLSGLDRSLEVYTKVKDAKRFELEITRRGLPVILTYQIVP